MDRKKGLKGFSLIEVVVTLVIIGLVIGIAVPEVQKSLQKQALASYARTFAGDIRHVRQRNINGELNPAVRIQILGDRYVIRQGTKVLESMPAPEGIRFLGRYGSEIYFSGMGVPLGLGAATIDLTNNLGHVYQVVITVSTGRVRFAPHPEKW